MPRRAAAVLGLGLAAVLTGCASFPSADSCAAGEARRQVAEMVFGRNIGDQLGVSETDFARFLDEEVTPRFPEGLTVLDTQGRWLSQGHVVREPGKLVMLILSGRPDDRRKLAEIAHAYGSRFHQEAVLTLAHSSCVALWPAQS